MSMLESVCNNALHQRTLLPPRPATKLISGLRRKNFAEVQVYSRPQGGPGGGPPGAGEFSKIWKNFLKKIATLFFENFENF